MRLAYYYDMIAGSGTVNVYSLPNSLRIWDPDRIAWRVARRGDKKLWEPHGSRSNRVVPMFPADDGGLFGRMSLAVGLLPQGSRGRLVLWFFGRGMVGLVHVGKYRADEWPKHADLPDEIRKQFPERQLEAMAMRLFPGDLDEVTLAEARRGGLLAAEAELDHLEHDLRLSLGRAATLRESIKRVLSLDKEKK